MHIVLETGYHGKRMKNMCTELKLTITTLEDQKVSKNDRDFTSCLGPKLSRKEKKIGPDQKIFYNKCDRSNFDS